MVKPAQSSHDVGFVPGRWGGPEQIPDLSDDMRKYLAEHVGVARSWARQAPDLDAIGPPRLDEDLQAQLRDIVGADHLDGSAQGRWSAAGGASYVDYVLQRAGETTGIPDLVISPGTHEEVQEVLRVCSAAKVSVVPVGGGTSVVGGLRAPGTFIALKVSRMRGVIDIDEVSGVARVEAGITGPMLEAILGARGFTLGHLPQSWQRASIGGYLATRSAGQASTGYGRSDDMVESVRLAAPVGSITAGHVPSSAAGPELLQLVVGSEGSLGVITEASLRIRRSPGARRYEAWLFPGFDAGREAFRVLAQSRISADVMRLSDIQETATTLLMSAPAGLAGAVFDAYVRRRGIVRDEAALAIMGWEATDDALLADRRKAAVKVLRAHGGVSLGRRAGESWRRHRFDGPHLRDALMDAGYLVETVETSTTWSNLGRLREQMHAALTGALETAGNRPYVMTHISHVYETGASLYTTVICVADPEEPVGQWRAAKSAVMDVIADGGGTITHHHAVGRDHAPWLEHEIGERGIAVLRAVKATLDPHGICNPGVLGLE